MSNAIDNLIEHKRDIIKGFLAQLPDGHVGKFKRIYGEVDTMNPDKMEGAITLCERSLHSFLKKSE